MDAVELLEHQHRTLEKQFTALKNSESPSKTDLNSAADLLASHILTEEQLFYPAVLAKRTEDILLESLEEHLSLKRVLVDLLELASKDQHFTPKLHVLAEQLEHHHGEEEKELFPKVKKLLDADARKELGARMQEKLDELAHHAPRNLLKEQTDEAGTLPRRS